MVYIFQFDGNPDELALIKEETQANAMRTLGPLGEHDVVWELQESLLETVLKGGVVYLQTSEVT